jgi:CRISPR-associated protein Csx3
METYNISFAEGVLKIAFGAPASNDQIVKDAEMRLGEMIASGELSGGAVIRVNGRGSLPVAMVLAHKLAHLYQAVACFDPKMSKYVVTIAHGSGYAVGDLID